MTTQMEDARRGNITPAMASAAQAEKVSSDTVRDALASGRAVLPFNPVHACSRPAVVGRPFRTKVNANIGRSPQFSSREEELEKMEMAVEAGADFVMDLSIHDARLDAIRKALLAACPVPLGTVPIYDAFCRAGGRAPDLTGELLLSVIKQQAEEGVDFMTLHAGLLKDIVGLALKRVMGIASRGGAILAEWMMHHDCENPLYSHWDDVLDICLEHDVTVSLGDGLRPGCLADASDDAQFAELDVLGDLVRKCRDRGVQVMVEGPGHIPLDQIRMNMEREQTVCDHAPFYVLGPVVTDIAPGYDHITSSIGATSAAYHGASLLCAVTPAEHLGLPTGEEVRTGIVAYRIAAHAADVARGLPGARAADDAMARARMDFDWDKQFQLALDGRTARKRYEQTHAPDDENDDHCSMCGKTFCAVRTTKRVKKNYLPAT